MFGDPVTNPMGWDKVKLGDVCSDIRYGSNSKSFDKDKINNIPIIRIPNVIGGVVNKVNIKYTNVEKKEYEKLVLRKGDLLFVRSNGNPDYIGRCAVFNGDFKCIYASYLIRCRLDNFNLINPVLLNFLINFKSYRKIILKLAKTTAGNYNMNTQGLRSLLIIIPPITLQNKFAEIIENIEEQKQKTKESLAYSEELFNALVQKYFGA